MLSSELKVSCQKKKELLIYTNYSGVEHILLGHAFSAIAKDMKETTIGLTKELARFAK